ncbi:MAG: 2-oxo acid dehydrogenase subunit E2 [Clostridia bacterium]|nr:branched-chain alpha-keto acid dehydrogenase subunit E2 [Bacillota bacterium]MBO2520970.1 branched-chain alpha-keto acid dehydrogenase subunit E2 [Bacillota bacterium]
MPKEIVMPKLGESVVEGVIGRWLKAEGDFVDVDEPLVEVDTDKVNAEVPSPYRGVVHRLLAREGETVAVGQVIAIILEEGEAAPEAGGEQPAAAAQVAGEPRAAAREEALNGAGPARSRSPHAYSPAVRRLAAESGIDPATVVGTGRGGRVSKKDMERAIADAGARAKAAPPAPAPGLLDADEVVPITRMRRTIAERMVQSKRTVPHAWTMVEVDVTRLVEWRESIKEEFRRREGFNLTYLPFVVKAAVEALREYPILNSTWEEDRIVIKRRINIGIAVDVDDGIIVPVIRDADQKSIVGIAREIADLAARARAGTLTPDDVAGGTFTINNTGAFGSILSAPIINYPQAAILSMETITKRPVVVGDAIAIRSMMNLCMSLDHRVLDGAVCGRFLRSVKRRLESYDANTPLY